MTAPELASASWLGRRAKPGQLVYADRYGQLRLIAMDGILRGLTLDITPLTLNRSAWVYASSSNILDGRARALFDDRLAIYDFPLRFIKAHYDTVFTDGSSEVFHR